MLESQGANMAFIDTSKLPIVERLPGWRGRYFDSPSMTFAHYEFDAGSSIHEHSHPQEEVYHIIEGELELAIAGFTQRLGPGFVGVVPSNTLHAVKAISSGKVIVVDYPLRDLTLA
jgi:quercetin dioxygenase-like cupin family protein